MCNSMFDGNCGWILLLLILFIICTSCCGGCGRGDCGCGRDRDCCC